MAPMPVPPADGGDDDPVSGLQQGLRLSDVEGIAARRLDGAAEGSLGEALAIAATANAGDAAPQPTDAVGAVGESSASAPLVPLIDVRSAEIGRTLARKPLDAFSPMPMPPLLDVRVAVVTPADSVAPPTFAAPEIADDGEPVFMPTEDRQGALADTPVAPAMTPSPEEATAAQSIEPLTSALDAAVRLAADASVAAEALENLKRLLERKQQLESQLPHLAAGSQPTSASGEADVPASTPQPPLALPPLPLPLHAEQAAAGRSAAGRLVLPPAPRRRRRPPPERRVFDVRGFMAGFALSWAFGVVLYLFMTAG
jgi:hypothetical protein